MDERRRRYVPLDVDIAFRNTGSKLLERLGNEGLLIWMLYLAACKREPIEGTFTYTSEPEAWTKFGAQATSFTVTDFFTQTGRLKATRKRSVARITYVECVGWHQWNEAWKTQRRTERHAPDTSNTPQTHEKVTPPTVPTHTTDTRKTPGNTVILQNKNGTVAEQMQGPEVEVEFEVERTLVPDKPARKPDPLWDTLVAELGVTPITPSERGRWNKALKGLRVADATPAQIRARCRVYRNRWPNVSLTATALEANWGSLLSDEELAGARREEKLAEVRAMRGAA